MAELRITSGGKERVEHASALLSKAFEKDPLITYMLCHFSDEKRLVYLHEYFRTMLTAAGMNRATFDEAGDWASCAVFMPPGTTVDNPWTLVPAGVFPMLWNVGLGGCRRMLFEFGPMSAAAKVRHMSEGQKYHYVFFIGTHDEQRGKGLGSALLRNYQDRATRDNLPVWLEATTAHSRDIYARLGFEKLEEMVLGKAVVGADGKFTKGGAGVRIWAMIWWPGKVLEPKVGGT